MTIDGRRHGKGLSRRVGVYPMMHPMHCAEAIRTRRSIRRFDHRDVPDDLVAELVDLCRHAPSSVNGQPWCFVVVRSPETKRRLAALKNEHCPPEKSAYPADFLALAPVVVVVAVERSRSFGRGRESAVLATGYLLLAARDRGLGGVYLSAYQLGDPTLAQGIAQLLGLPDDMEPVTVVPLGYPAEEPVAKGLRPLADIIHRERFDPDVSGRD